MLKNVKFMVFVLSAFSFMSSFSAMSFEEVNSSEVENSPKKTNSEMKEILIPIYSLFDGMRESNGDKVRAAFAENAVMHRAHGKLKAGGSAEKFAKAVESSNDKVWDEKIWDIRIQVDDKLASVWTEFAFLLDDKMSHCGVNSFQLYQFDEGWKIIYLVDTFRKDNCIVPEKINNLY